MDPLGQRIEVEPGRAGDDDLTVEDAAVGQVGPQRIHQLGEVPSQRLFVAAAQYHVVPVPEDDPPEAVPLGLVVQTFPFRQFTGQLGQHRCHRRHDGENHDRIVPRRKCPGPGPYSPCPAVQARKPSKGRAFITRSTGTPTRAACSQPFRCHSSWPGAWASVSTTTLQPRDRANSRRGSGGSRRSGRELISTAVPLAAHAPNTASASKAEGGRPLPTTIRPVQWPRMSVWGLSTARTIRLVISGSSILSFEWTLATTTSSWASNDSSWSRPPSVRMSTSIPVRMRKGASSSLSSATTSSCRRRRSESSPWATVSRGLWSVRAQYRWP